MKMNDDKCLIHEVGRVTENIGVSAFYITPVWKGEILT